MSDEEIDREWKPSARPQSTMAKSFSLALNDLFKIDNSLADLDAAVYEKKQAVSTQTSELEALEARLKATEERLKKAAASPPGKSSTGRSSPRSRAPLSGETFQEGEQPTSPLASEFRHSRPNTGRQTKEEWTAPMPGALPPTPGASEDGDHPPPQK